MAYTQVFCSPLFLQWLPSAPLPGPRNGVRLTQPQALLLWGSQWTKLTHPGLWHHVPLQSHLLDKSMHAPWRG